MSKNRTKQANNRAKKAKERTRDRQIERAREAVTFKQKKATSLTHFISNPSTGYEFWLHHGCNFLLSSYEEGLWSPTFPEVYAGKVITRTEFFKRIMASHFNAGTNQLSPAGTKAILWSSLKPKEMFALVVRARQYAWAAKKEPTAQAQPAVWHFLHEVMEKFTEKLDSEKKTDSGSFTIPADQYGKILPQAIAATVSGLSGVPDPSDPSVP